MCPHGLSPMLKVRVSHQLGGSTGFDRLARSLSSRRSTLGHLVVGGVLAALGLQGGSPEAAAAPCPKGKKHCKGRCIPKRACCTTAQCRPAATGKVCRQRRCVCRPDTKLCQGRCIHPAAACPPQPDAACPPGGGSANRSAWFHFTAQTFTEPNGGPLNAAAIWLRSHSAATVGTYELRLNTVDPVTGVPQHTTLAIAQRPSSQVSYTTFGWVPFTFQSPAQLVPGTRYALVLTMVGGNRDRGACLRTAAAQSLSRRRVLPLRQSFRSFFSASPRGGLRLPDVRRRLGGIGASAR